MAQGVRTPPHDNDAEQAALGALMLDTHGMDKVADMLSPEDFYSRQHTLIFGAIRDLYGSQIPIDVVSVSLKLKDQGNLDAVGGRSYLASLVSGVTTGAHVQHYAEMVRKKRVLRDLIQTSVELTELGYGDDSDVASMLDQAEQRIFGITQRTLKKGFVSTKDALTEAWERIDKLHKGDGAIRGVSSGFKELDNILSGFQPSDLIILAARPSLGKTTLALNIALHVAVHEKKPVGLFSLEMSTQQLIDRLISSQAGVDLWKLRTGQLKDADEFARVRDALEVLSNAPIFIDDAASATALEMRAMARRLKSEHGLGLVIIDYLQLMESSKKSDSRVQEVSEFSRSLKSLAKELDVPVLALSQMSRLVEQRPNQIPRLSDLRESGSIEQDADVVMFIYREDKTKKDSQRENIAEIMIEKHRNGPTGKVDLFFDAEHVRFASLERNIDSAFAESVKGFDDPFMV